MQKVKERYSKEKAAEYYLLNKEAIKESQRIDPKTCQKKKKTRLKNTKEKDTNYWFSTKEKHYKINEICFFSKYKMSEITLKFENIKVNKETFHKSK